MNAIKILLKTGKRFDKKIEKIKKDGKGNYNFMCVFDEIYDDGVEYGLEQGIRPLIKFSKKLLLMIVH